MVRLSCSAFLLLGLSFEAAAFPTADYDPIAPGNSWTNTRDGVVVTDTVLAAPATINGYVSTVVQSSNGDISYDLHDANGIQTTGDSTSVTIPNYGATTQTMTFSPPMRLLPYDATLGVTYASSGTVSLVYAGIGTYALKYAIQSTPIGFESVSVPAGTFNALKLQSVLSISGSINGTPLNVSSTVTTWLAIQVGAVQSQSTVTSNGVTTSHNTTLNAYNVFVPVTTPSPFSFAPQAGAVPGSMAVSGAVTVSGINSASPVSISGGEYSLNGGPYTALPGTVNVNDRVTLRLRAPMAFGASANAVLTIGGASGSFGVTTLAALPAGNQLYYSSETGDFIGLGATDLLAGPQFAVTPAVTSAGMTTFYISQSTTGWTLSLKAPGGGPLLVGSYENAQRAAFAAAGSPGLDFSGNGRGCNVVSGRFDVLDAAYDASGNVQRMAVDFEQHCEGVLPALFGQLRYNSGVPVDITLNSGNGEFPTGWTLAGNSGTAPIPVSGAFGDPASVVSVWKWVPSGSATGIVYPTWAFYTPAQADGGAAYAASKGYEFLSAINPGEGYWVNAKAAFTASLSSGLAAATFQGMSPGWHLMSESAFVTPAAFNAALSLAPPGSIPNNFISLWAWDNVGSSWFFYAPSLDASGGLSAYAASKGYLDFTSFGKTLRPGTGFWVNR